MRDIEGRQFNSNSPMRNYVKLNERIDELQTRLRKLEQGYLELASKS